MQEFSPALLLALRRERKLTREQLAAPSDRGYWSIRSYELGTAVPPADVLAKMANALGVEVGALFIETEAVA